MARPEGNVRLRLSNAVYSRICRSMTGNHKVSFYCRVATLRCNTAARATRDVEVHAVVNSTMVSCFDCSNRILYRPSMAVSGQSVVDSHWAERGYCISGTHWVRLGLDCLLLPHISHRNKVVIFGILLKIIVMRRDVRCIALLWERTSASGVAAREEIPSSGAYPDA